MNKALAIAGNVLRNKWFWTGLIVLVLLLLLVKYWSHITAFFKPDRGNYANDPALTDDRRLQLEALARDVYAAIHGLGFQTDAIAALNDLNDTELRYLGRFYKSLGSASLKTDIDDEWMWDTDIDDILIARLNQLAL